MTALKMIKSLMMPLPIPRMSSLQEVSFTPELWAYGDRKIQELSSAVVALNTL